MARNYKQEYARYQGTLEQKKRRAQRNKVRRRALASGRVTKGSGFDIHRFEYGEYLTLGGVKIPFSKGLQAHSDGDVLVHSLIDAILGAINAGDIGAHFPDDDVQYKNANSLDLLQNIYKLMSSEGYFLMNMEDKKILKNFNQKVVKT